MPPIRNRKNSKIDNTTREGIIDLVSDQGKPMALVARYFNIPTSTVRSIVNTFFQTNRIEKLPKGGNRSSRIEQSHLDWCRDVGL
ncbi:hypothetical protein BGZ96_004700 [Linnemannia gamsii]|uniref:HTH psq-type domain-containing protein n=1 Tax=Linnemannia gamsii TaxID=64522 RepID=A0ABQ7JHV8_9FUNG|nr:hypothetical protein BGZ96_004700 [Linnemannia gamsii]